MSEAENPQPWPIQEGGLMRCCIATYVALAPLADQSEVGDTLPCRWCSSRMILTDGFGGPMWQWDREMGVEDE